MPLTRGAPNVPKTVIAGRQTSALIHIMDAFAASWRRPMELPRMTNLPIECNSHDRSHFEIYEMDNFSRGMKMPVSPRAANIPRGKALIAHFRLRKLLWNH